MPKVLSLLLQLSEKQTVPQYLETVFRYIISTVDDVSVDELTKIVKESLSEQQGDAVMTLAEKLRKEGYDKGIQHGTLQGIQQGLIEGIEAMMSLKFTHDAARIMPLIYQLKDISLLKVVKSTVLTAKNADELIDIIKKF